MMTNNEIIKRLRCGAIIQQTPSSNDGKPVLVDYANSVNKNAAYGEFIKESQVDWLLNNQVIIPISFGVVGWVFRYNY